MQHVSAFRESSRRRDWSRPGGFTLIELLIVIGLIAVLAALMLGVLGSAKAKSKGIACTHNLKQQGIILTDFVTTHSRYPLFFTFPADRAQFPENVSSWIGTLFLEQLRSDTPSSNRDEWRGILRCATARRPSGLPPRQGYSHYGYNSDGLAGRDYVGNLGLGGALDGTGQRPVRQDEVVSPVNMIAIGDAVIGWNDLYQDGLAKIGRMAEAAGTKDSFARVQKRHGGQLNVLFCDGHVAPVELAELFASTKPEALARWNRDHLPHMERLE